MTAPDENEPLGDRERKYSLPLQRWLASQQESTNTPNSTFSEETQMTPKAKRQHAKDRFIAKVESLMERGMSRQEAIYEAQRECPDLHREYLEAINPGKLVG
jgi:hypothetical protein